MTTPFNCMRTFPVSRAEAYPHSMPDDPLDAEGPNVVLDDHRLTVDTLVTLGTVTLAASTRNAAADAYGQEFDLAPADARALGRQLIAAAGECERAR
jgi:hypothetical protein